MECNRDEATRAKEIAENKFSNKDMKGAKKFALKAQSLYPDLDGISQFLAILDVYVAAENKTNGELDYYEILGVNSVADDDTVRKHYRKLALALHPDKNKSFGAEGAFKYVSEAWNLLSDKDKRSAYDHKRNVMGFKQKVQTQNGGSRPPNGFHYFTKTKTKNTAATTKAKDSTVKRKDTTNKVHDTAAKASDISTDAKNKTNSQKENVKAGPMKTGPASVFSSSNKQMTFWTVCRRCKLQYEFKRMYVNLNLVCPTCYGPFHATETPPPNINGSLEIPKSSEEVGKTVVNGETCKTVNGEPGHGSNSQWVPFSKASSPADVSQAANLVQQTYEKVKREREEAEANTKREKALRRKIAKKEAKLSSQSSNSEKTKPDVVNGFVANNGNGPTLLKKDVSVSDTDIKKRLMNKSRMEIKKKLHEWSAETVKDSKNLEMDVPDPDFHNFDRNRSEKCFEQGQVWAAYDDPDGMPRSYAMIHEVISVDPFKMKICWLDSKSGKKEAFGEFKTGRYKIVSAANYFSHKVNFTKQESGNIRVFPKKGDVYALYRNNHQTHDKYDIVEVDQYDEQTGVTVTPLVKVAGFKTVFHRHLDPKVTRAFLKKEMSRFSYQIPCYLLTGQESPNAPKGCLELDPASVPSEFLQVTENANNMAEDRQNGGLAEVDNMVVEE